MTLTQQQKALVENVIMVVEEETSKWTHHEQYNLEYTILPYAFDRVIMILQHKKPRDIRNNAAHITAIAEVIGKEVRRARSYKDMTAEEIIVALDAARMILRGDN
jgi:hypothetical protein